MKLRLAAAREGWTWVRQGLVLLRRQPLALSATFGLMFFSLGLLLMLPLVGPLLAAALMPAYTAAWVRLTPAVERGERLGPMALFAPLREPGPRRLALLKLGAWHAATVVLAMGLADLVWPATELPPPTPGSTDGGEEMVMPGGELIFRQLLLLPIALVFWHAPVLIDRSGAGVGKAVFASAVASLRNAGAFVVYALGWAGLSLLLGLALSLVMLVVRQPTLLLALAMPLAMLLSSAFYASLHASVHGCIDFDAGDVLPPVAGAEPPGDGTPPR